MSPNPAQSYTTQEQKNIDLAKEYMRISYSPKGASAENVKHLCAPGNKFIAPTTFPGVNTLEEYAEGHAEIMKSIADLHIVSFDVCFAHSSQVCLRYTAEGTHCGEPHNGIQASGKKAQWTAAAIFEVDEGSGKLIKFIKDWDKLSMWKQLGWNKGDECA
ncbi:hypothetical protein HDV00_000578 [Rhizophlyctis rosea]|nr:hypothetical protein HDV00_000578 [Rhizophlyctis rosea]